MKTRLSIARVIIAVLLVAAGIMVWFFLDHRAYGANLSDINFFNVFKEWVVLKCR